MIAVALFACGCGSSAPKVVPVKGVVKHQGQPVPKLLVFFHPEKGRSSWGRTDEEGRFELLYDAQQKGALIGNHTIYVVYDELPSDPMEIALREASRPQKKPKAIARIEAKYGKRSSSPLKQKITQPEENLRLNLD